MYDFRDLCRDKLTIPQFIYTQELEKVTNIIIKNDRFQILILGGYGSGKTTILNQVNDFAKLFNRKSNNIIYGRNMGGDFSVLRKSGDIVYLDDLDKTENAHKILGYLRARKSDKIVCTASSINGLEKYFTHIIELPPLTDEQIFSYMKFLGLDTCNLNEIIERINMQKGSITPRDVKYYAISNINRDNYKDFYLQFRQILYQYEAGIDFGTDIVVPKKEIIIPPMKEIIKDVAIMGQSLLQKAKDNPDIIYKFTPREFEEMVCDFLDKKGYDVELTKQTKDGGKDIIVVQKSLLGEFVTYVECKKYDVNNPISVGLVKQLYGTVMADNATAGLLVTTSYFSKDAKEFRNTIKNRMSLMDYNDLVQELNKLHRY